MGESSGPKSQDKNLETPNHKSSPASTGVYWRVEGSLLDLTTVRPVAFFTWNAQTFLERWVRRGLVFLMAVLRPFLYAANRVFATRVVHTVLRGVSRDRLDFAEANRKAALCGAASNLKGAIMPRRISSRAPCG
jgi:hypothetical protein